MDIREAFEKVCEDAKPAQGCYVSLYRVESFYGGAEEGGWWGSDYILVASKWFDTEEQADSAHEAIQLLAKGLTEEAKQAFGQLCLHQLEDAERRGMDANDLYGEVDGEDRYCVMRESVAGENASKGDRHYC
jgi:hypothetical protein